MDRNKPSKLKSRLLPLALCLVMWLPRVLTPSAFVSADELAWAYRSLRFLKGLLEGNLVQTFQTGHPGVLTMWAGAIGATAYQLERGEPPSAAVADLPVLSDGTFDPYDVDLLRRASPVLPFACVATATIDALLVAAVFAVLWRSFDRGTALLALGLLAFDPLHMALSRQLHPEALPAAAMLLSLATLYAFFKKGERGMLALSGAAAGLAVLEKAYALFLLPYAVLLSGWHMWSVRSEGTSLALSFRRWTTTLILWGLAMTAVIFCLWPALWIQPLAIVQEILSLSTSFAQGGGTRTASFFLGQPVRQAGAAFYPVALLFLATPLTTVGFLLAVFTILFANKENKDRRFMLYLLGFVFLFVIFLSLSSKKFSRYAIAALLGLDVLAAMGWQALYTQLRWRPGQWLLATAAILQIGYVLSFHPYYPAHYNPLVGGLRQATRVLPVGGGEGTDLAAKYLAAKENAADLRVATWDVPGLAPYFPGDLLPPTSPNWQTADYLLISIRAMQEQKLPDVDFGGLELEQVFQVRHVDYAWLYRNRYYEAPLREIASRAKAEDALFLDAPSVLLGYLPDGVQAYVSSGDEEEAQVIVHLSQISQRSRQAWLLTHPGGEMGQSIRWQLDTHARLLSEWAFPGCQLALYQLQPGVPFGPARPVTLEAPAPVKLDGNLALTALALTGESVEYRQKLGVTLQWQAMAATRPAYAISLRLVDEAGYRWAQADAHLRNPGGQKTAAWLPGEQVSTRHLLNIPAGMPPGRYRLTAVPYIAGSDQGVEISDAAGQPLPGAVPLAAVTVRSAALPPSRDELPVTSDVRDCVELGDLQVLGYDLATAELSASPVPLVICWQALRPPADNYQAVLRLRGPAEWTRSYPLSHSSYPASRWRGGEIVCTPFVLATGPDLPGGTYRLAVNLTDGRGQQVAAKDVPLTEVQVRQEEHVFDVPPIGHPMARDFGEVARLLGYDLEDETSSPSSGVKLTLYWQARNEAALSVNYAVFTHLLDPSGQIVAQHDGWPGNGTRPTTGWVKDEIIVDAHLLSFVAPDFEGTGQIAIGLYDQATGERVHLPEGSDHLLLPTQVTIAD
jgi:hypothetical protein